MAAPTASGSNGQWGIVDVDDCVNGARYWSSAGGWIGERLAISGGSAGGYTTLCALTFRDVFKRRRELLRRQRPGGAGQDTHKFESRYLDRLIGPYPERAAISTGSARRSTLTDRLVVPGDLLPGARGQGGAAESGRGDGRGAAREGLPVAYLAFEGEQHGFRRAENIKRALDAELYFYATLLFRASLRF